MFLSQRGSLLGGGKTFTFVNEMLDQTQNYLAKGSGWVMDKAFPNIVGEAQKRGEMIAEGVEEQKEKVSESILEKAKNYFSGISDAIFHPGEKEENKNDTCECPGQPAQTWYEG